MKFIIYHRKRYKDGANKSCLRLCDYDKAFVVDLICDNVFKALNRLDCIFNVSRPIDFDLKGWTLSISDVVYCSDNDTLYFLESYGFKELDKRYVRG